LRQFRKTASVGAKVTSRGRLFQRRLYRPPETHNRRQWKAVYVGSLAARMTTTGDDDSWSGRRAGCSRRDTVAPDRADIGK